MKRGVLASQLRMGGGYNGSELNQQSTLMLMLLCLSKLIIQDRAPPPIPPHARRVEDLPLQLLAKEIDDELLRLSSHPH